MHIPMDSIRVHLGTMPPMLREIISDLLSAEADVEIVGFGDHDSPSFVAAAEADVLLTAQPPSGTDLAALVEGQTRAVVVLSPERNACLAVTLTHRELPLESVADLSKVLREAIPR